MGAKRTDANQQAIVKAFRSMGATVWITSEIGRGAPDIVVGFRGVNLLVEIKDGAKPLSAQKLTDVELDFHQNWRGQICIIRSIDDAIALINKIV